MEPNDIARGFILEYEMAGNEQIILGVSISGCKLEDK
jgi:hypothetical protein